MAELGGRLAIVTGTAGLGLAIARGLAVAGGDVIIAGRDAARGGAAVADIKETVPTADVRFEMLDLADLDSIEGFARRIIAAGRPVDVLVNSAGLVATERRLTKAGFEQQFGVNYLGHFALTGRLLPVLRRARVVTLGGAAYKGASIDFTNLNAERSFSALSAGGQSMLAKVMFMRELQRRSDRAAWQITSIGADPGFARTGLLAKSGGSALITMLSGLAGQLIGQSVDEGAQTALLAATADDAVAGGYYVPGGMMGTRGAPRLGELAPAALDDGVAARLWDTSQEMTGRPFPERAPEAA